MVSRAAREIGRILGDAMGDAETIAKSAVSMGIERTQDLGGNPVITLIMMEALCKAAIQDYSEQHPGVAGMPMEEGLGILRDIIQKGVDDRFKEFKAT